MDPQYVDAVWDMISGNTRSEENRTATSTPNSDIQRKSRKSWFEKRKESKFEIAVEKKAKRRSGKRKSEEEIETLLLTHFTNPPKIDFGKSRIGFKKSRILRIKNPHEYPQTVKVERFPFKKNFSVDCDEVVVEAESSALITINWCPESDGSYREMILFIVDNAYRLQAFVIGRCETAAEKKKSKGGLLGRRVKRPFSVVQTSNLANIAKSYSPQKDTKKRKNLQELTQAKNDSADHTNEARVSDGFIPPMVIPVESVNPQDVQNENENLGNESKSSGKNGHRRSSTYRVPYIDVSPIKTIPNSTPMRQEKKTKEADKDDVSLKTTDCTEFMPKTPSSAICPVSTRTFVSPNSFLHDSLLSFKGTDNQPVHSTVLPTPERCLVQEQTRKFVSPNSFLKDLNTTKEKLKMKCDNEIPSPNSVLNESVPHEIVLQQLAFVKKNLKEKGEEFMIQNKIGTEPDGQQTSSLGTTNKEENVLPNGDTFLGKTGINEDLRRGTFTVGSTTQHSSSKRELFSNESTVISKTETVATHSMQYTVSEQSVCQGTFVVQGSQSRAETRKETFGAKSSENFQSENMEYDMRRETFAVTDPKIHTDERNFRNLEKSQIGTGNPFSIIPEGTSPRRTTFTVKGRGTRNKPSVRKLSSSESSKIHSKWKRRSQESNFQINEATEVHTPMKFIEDEEQNCQDINNSASEDRILYFDKVEVTERLCDDVLPTPERLVTASIKTPSKNTHALTSRSNVQMTTPHAHFTSINEKFSYMATPERVLMVSHSSTNHNAEHCVHHISTVREEEEEQDSVLIKAFMDKEEEEGRTLTCKEKMTVVSEGKTDTTIHELSLDRDHKAVLTTSGSETVTKLRPDIINVDNNDPNQETVTDICEGGKQISNSDSKNLSGSLTVTKEKPDVIVKKTHGDLVLPTPERNLNSPCLDVPKNMKYEKVSNSKQLFSPGNLSSSFGSPKRLPDSPLLNDITNRASLTVTKERPSDALMEFTQKQVKSCLFDVDQEEVTSNIRDMCPARENFCDTIPEETEEKEPVDTVSTEHSNKCDGDNDKNNTYDKSENKSFPTTPHQLPSSPNPDMSRRSTHVVEHPKVLDLSKADRRRLFSPLTTDDCKDEDATEKEQKTDTCIIESLEPTCTVPENRSKTGSSSEPYAASVPLITETKSTCESLDKNMETQQNKLSVKETGSTRSLSHAASRVRKDGKPVPGKQSRNNPTHTSSGKESVVKSKSSNTQSSSKEIQSRNRCAAKQNALTEKASKTTVSGVKRNKVGLPQSKLVLTKKCKTALPKHPMPFASKNMYYDERWMEKQERGFTHWLNFLLTPAEEYQLTYNKTKVDAGKLFMENPPSKVLLAPTKEVLSFRAYAATQRLNQLRRAACKLFQSDAVVRVIQKIEAEIDSHRLLIRKDRMVHADLGLKQGILDMLLSFNPLWLRIGLETIYGEIIPVQRNDDVYGLSRFIVTRLLGSPDIAQEYAHPTVPHLYKDGYAAAIARHTLKKFLLLVYFLDHAKTKHLIKHDPCLFCKDVEYKNCKAMLVELSRCYLAGEGDVTRHLGYLGYVVTHTQVPLDEFEYAVNNIATDLRDGVRLTKVVELLSNKVGLTKKLRAPAISRLQKVHNMEVVFSVLKEHGIDFTKHATPIIPRDIVDGHRERTLRFLWTLILQFQVSVLLSEDQLKEEIEILQKSLKVRNQLSALHRYEQGLKEKRRESSEPELHTKNKLLGLVLKWCRVVCAFYDIKIENFTVSFGDGRALCHLVHHYHPSLLPRESIQTRTMMSYYMESDQKRLSTGDSSLSDSPEPFIVNEDPKLYEELLANEKENFKLLYEKVSELGNIPMMVRSIDMSNTIPDEKVVVTYVTYLCARLLDIRHESRAARIIQLAWRKHMLRKSKRELEVKVRAAIVLQRAFRSYHDRVVLVRRTSAAVVIQSNWRRVLAMWKLKQLRWERDHRAQVTAANVIKHHLRGLCRRKQYHRLIRSTVLIQSLVRRYLTLKNLHKCHQAATTIQTHYLGYKLTQQTRREFTETRQAVLTIQRWYRDRLREQKAVRERAAVTIQAWWRMVFQRKTFTKRRKSAILIQKCVRGYVCRMCFLRKKEAACYIQQKFRGIMEMKRVRHTYKQLYKTCLFIQRKWKIVQQQKKELMIQSTVKIQSWFRGYITRKQYQLYRHAVVKVQASVRGFLVRKQHRALQKAAVLIQQQYRAVKTMREARSQYRNLKRSTVVVQSLLRRKLCRDSFLKHRKAAIVIQSYYRGYQQRKIYKQVMSQHKKAAIVIQSYYRGYQQRKIYKQVMSQHKKAAIVIQSYYRGYQQRKIYKQVMSQREKAAIVIHSYYRGYQQRKIYKQVMSQHKKAAIVIQSYYRGYQQRKIYKQVMSQHKKAAIVIQSYYRGYQQRKIYKQVMSQHKKAALMIQSYYRGYQQRKIYNQVMSQHKRAALTIQSFYRGMKHRKVFLVQRHAAIMIQKSWKGYSTKRRYSKMQQAARVLQMKWRRRLEVQRERSKFLAQKRAATVLQSHVRKFLVMRQNKRLKKAAIFTQSMIKMKKAKKEFQEKRRAVCILQARYRALRKGKKIRREFLIQKGAAITIQSFYRAFKVRQNVAATRIQTSVKRYLAEKKFKKLKQAVVACQRSFRAKVEMKNCVEHYRKVLDSVKSIQCWWRGVRCRRRYVQLKSASILLQTRFRGVRQRRKYQMQKSSAIVLQRHIQALFDGRRERTKYLQLRAAVICVQSWWRGTTQRVMYRNTVINVIKVQSCVRRFLVQRRYLELRKFTIFIQQRYRSQLVKRKCLTKYTLMKQSAILIQRCFRQYVQQKQRKIHSAATTIQSYYKAYCVRKWFIQQRNSAVVIQKYTRMFLDRKKYCQIRKSATIIQQNWKAFIARRKFLIQKGAVITLQCHLRRHFSQNQYRKLKNATLYIQSVIRMRNQRRKFLKIKHAVQLIQDRMRAFLQGQRVRRHILIQHGAAITIQSSFRGYMAWKQFHCMKKSAVIIQSMVRMHRARKVHTCLKQSAIVLQRRYRDHLEAKRKRREYLCKRLAVITIQAHYRRYLCQKNYDQLRQSTIKLQAAYRMYHYRKHFLKTRAAATVIQNKLRATILAKQTQRKFLVMKGAAISIQAWYKGSVQRTHYKHILVCVCRLQATLRGYVVRKHIRELQQAVCVVQRRYREKKLTDQLRNAFLEKKGAAITIQAWYRGYVQRVKYQQCLICVCKLQCVIRGYLERKHLQELRKAACIVQRRYREKRLTQSLHKEFQQKRKSAVCIQRAYRAMMQRRKEILAQQRAIIVSKFVSAVQYNLSAIQIQRAYRKYQTLCAAKKKMNSILYIQHWIRAKLVSLRFLRFMRSITKVQRLCKVYLRRREHSARTIQAAYRKWQARKQEQRKIHAAVTLQAVWRGRQVRIKCKNKKLANIRQRIEEANRSATEEKKLCNRTASALDYLLKYKHLSQILDALMHLDVATRLSSQCCVRMVEVHAVQVIYTLIQSCNRSQPHMEIIRYSVSILLNLAKYDKTVGAVYVSGSVDILLELLQIYREKGVIFYRTCTLLGILGIDLNRRMTIASDPKFKDKIKSLHVLVSRKNKVDETRLLRQARQLAAKSFNCTLPVHVPVKKAHKIRPDWVLQRDKMHEIDNPMQAINFVMDNYNITPKK